jgi:hypothetical protein
MSTENIYQMFLRLGGAGFYVKRNSWSHPRAAARAISVGGLTNGALPGLAPYHQPPGAKKLIAASLTPTLTAAPAISAHRGITLPNSGKRKTLIASP